MTNSDFARPIIILVCAFGLNSCALLKRSDGSSPKKAHVLDTMDLSYSSLDVAPYQIPPAIEIDIHHLELDVRFDWDKEEVMGKAKLTLSAFFQAVDTIWLDARGFEILDIAYQTNDTTYTPKYVYDGLKIGLVPDERLQKLDTVVTEINYIARPTKLEKSTGTAILSDQGLYFINPTGIDPDKPRQIWTQGEPECNSAWFPSVDHPHEKFSQEIFITVDSSLQTISNGKLVYSTINPNGTRTDYWKQDQQHANYLAMLAVGEFALVKDQWQGKDVWYYLDEDYLPYAHDIFGNTPEMIGFYSELLGYNYAWDKYHQVVVKDFVSGAMENTSAVIHGDFVQLTDRELLDKSHEDVIAHELFHHWFGDLVTCSSWSQLTMNEGFATYGEYLWIEHKYGIEEARYHLQIDLEAYLDEASKTQKRLIRNHYNAADDLFDSHTYQKGARVLHLLRQELGDTAFFATLSHYLHKHEFQSVQVDDLKRAVLDATGQDLTWFFDQWYNRTGHPNALINYRITNDSTELIVSVNQQEIDQVAFRFHLPVAMGYNKADEEIKIIWIDESIDSVTIPVKKGLDWFEVDPFGDMLWEFTEEKGDDVWMSQLTKASSFISRERALIHFANQNPSAVFSQLKGLLKDPFWAIRAEALDFSSVFKPSLDQQLLAQLIEMSKQDQKSIVRASAFAALDSLSQNDTALNRIYLAGLKDSSYAVIRSCLSILLENDPCLGSKEIGFLENETHGSIRFWVSRVYASCADPKYLSFFENASKTSTGLDLFLINNDFTDFAARLHNEKVYDSLVKSLTESALNGESWWARYSAIQGLGKAEVYYESEIETLELKKERSAGDDERAAALKNKKASLSAMIEEIKEMQVEDEMKH
jgi:aminopeptidase N